MFFCLRKMLFCYYVFLLAKMHGSPVTIEHTI